MTNWNTLSKPKNQGGLGIKKFGLMNKAMIAKQYWRICKNPNLLVSKILKSKYCLNEDLHSHEPKTHASWIWRTIMNPANTHLKQRVWRVGRGFNIPTNHPAWYKATPSAPNHLMSQISTVADLIDQNEAKWKSNIITQLYDRTDSEKILNIPLANVDSNSTRDKIIWPHSLSGDYQVKKAYESYPNLTPTSIIKALPTPQSGQICGD